MIGGYMGYFILILCLSLLEGKEYTIHLPVIENARIKIDGKLNEQCWNQAAKIGDFVQVHPEEGKEPTCETEVLTWTDRVNLYIGFICYDNEPSRLRFARTDRDRFTPGDWINIKISTDNPPSRVYELFVNPGGTQVDFICPSPEQADITFDLEFEAQSQIFNDRWTVEVAIPFKNLRFKTGRSHHFRVDFARIYSHGVKEEYSSWIPHSKNDPVSFEKMGHLYIDTPLSLGRALDFLPYTICGLKREEKKTFDWRAGISIKLMLTSNIILDCAIQPDFSQIEADVPPIDINTPFALYYPEKRPLFLEKKDIFDSPLSIVYTRTINDPIGVVKITGALSNTEVGYILSRDNRTLWILPFRDKSFPLQTEVKSVSNIVRVRHKLGGDSYIGFFATNREGQGYYNRILTNDGELRFLKRFKFTYQGCLSFTHELNDTSITRNIPPILFDKYTSGFDGEKFSGNAFKCKLMGDTRYFDFGLWNKVYSPTFRADNGFIKYNARNERGMNVNLKFWPNKYGITHISPRFSFENSVCYKDNSELKSTIDGSLMTTLIDRLNLSATYKKNSLLFGGKSFKNLGEIGGNLSYFWGNFLLGVFISKGQTINYLSYPLESGNMGSHGAWFDFTPIPVLRLNLSYGRYLLWNIQGERVIDNISWDIKTTYYIRQSTTWRLNFQYSPKERSVFLWQIFSFEPTPFTRLFIGSNHTLRISDGTMKQDTYQLFIKVQYLFTYNF